MPKADRLPESLWGYAARRFAAGKRAVQVAQALGKPVAVVRAALDDPDFIELIECYERELAQPEEAQAREMRQAWLDGLNWHIEQRDVRTILWIAGKMGIPGVADQSRRAPAAGEQRGGGIPTDGPLAGCDIKFGPWDDVFEVLPEELQRQYREYEPNYVPPSERHDEGVADLGEAEDNPDCEHNTSVEAATLQDPDDDTAGSAGAGRTGADSAALKDDSPSWSRNAAAPRAHAANSNQRPKASASWRKEPLPRHYRAGGP